MSCMHNCCKSDDFMFTEEFISSEKIITVLNKLRKHFEKNVDTKNPIEMLAFLDLLTHEVYELQKDFSLIIMDELFQTNNQDLNEYIKKNARKHIEKSNVDEDLKKIVMEAFE